MKKLKILKWDLDRKFLLYLINIPLNYLINLEAELLESEQVGEETLFFMKIKKPMNL
jgi:hypothetical protein